ncbi:hypothetical protein HWV62_44641 [Athelia sp. TMB]|nr:hypothetical protein HWV62_44641 [Athelia sp. TMB]
MLRKAPITQIAARLYASAVSEPAQLAGTAPPHRFYVFLHTPQPPTEYDPRISSKMQRALLLNVVKFGGLVNFSWSEEQPVLSDSADGEAYAATAFTPSGRVDIPRLSMETLDSVVEELKSRVDRPTPNQSEDTTHLYVCTHGARDCRCGDMGGAVVRALREEIEKRKLSSVKVAEVGHVGGHKWAANLLVYPHGEWLGNLTPEAVPSVLGAIVRCPAKPTVADEAPIVPSILLNEIGSPSVPSQRPPKSSYAALVWGITLILDHGHPRTTRWHVTEFRRARSSRSAAKRAAVLVLLYEDAGNLRVLLTTRSKKLRSHPGETALPGGKVDETDKDVVHTARREAEEEVGLALDCPSVHILAVLEPVISRFRLCVTPVVALLSDPSILSNLRASEAEVDHIFTHPLEAILDPSLAANEPLAPIGGEDWQYQGEVYVGLSPPTTTLMARPQSPIPVTMIWENSPYFGLVHGKHCSVCDSYKDHRIKSALLLDPSFLAAASNQCACSNNIATMQNLREEVDSLRAQLQAAKDDIVSLTAKLSKGTRDGVLEAWVPEFTHPTINTLRPPPGLSNASFMTAQSEKDLHEMAGGRPLSPSNVSVAPSSVGSVELPVPRPWQPLIPVEQTVPSPTQNVHSSVADIRPDPSGWCVVGETRLRIPKFINQMERLIRQANEPGNHDHVAFVKALVAQAQQATEKSPLQLYLVRNWRKPAWQGGRSLNTEPNAHVAQPEKDDSPEVWLAWYAARPLQSPPLGVRRDEDGKPRLSDIVATRVMTRLRPNTIQGDQASIAARKQFYELATELISIPHQYEQLLASKNVAIATSVAYAPFHAPAEDMTMDSVACHFAACGISVKTVDEVLGPWLQERLRVSREREQVKEGNPVGTN